MAERGVRGLRGEGGEQGSCPFVQIYESVMCRVVFSSLQRRGGFDSQDFLSFIHAANDITEIVFVALPRPGTPGKLRGSRGSGRKREGERVRGRNRDRITKDFI